MIIPWDKGQIAKGLAIGPIVFGESGRLPGDWQIGLIASRLIASGRLPGDWQIGPIALELLGRLPTVWQPDWSYGEQ